MQYETYKKLEIAQNNSVSDYQFMKHFSLMSRSANFQHSEKRNANKIILQYIPSSTCSGMIVFFVCLLQISFASDETR